MSTNTTGREISPLLSAITNALTRGYSISINNLGYNQTIITVNKEYDHEKCYRMSQSVVGHHWDDDYLVMILDYMIGELRKLEDMDKPNFNINQNTNHGHY